MNVYEAIMLAANLIEQRPREFNFYSTSVPDGPGCGTPGCALGWIGAFLPDEQISIEYGPNFMHPCITGVARKMGMRECPEFYERMNELNKGIEGYWTKDAKICAEILRLYAAKYHAPAKRTDSELVAAMMTRVMGERIPEEA
jgi:hypothetical protein